MSEAHQSYFKNPYQTGLRSIKNIFPCFTHQNPISPLVLVAPSTAGEPDHTSTSTLTSSQKLPSSRQNNTCFVFTYFGYLPPSPNMPYINIMYTLHNLNRFYPHTIHATFIQCSPLTLPYPATKQTRESSTLLTKLEQSTHAHFARSLDVKTRVEARPGALHTPPDCGNNAPAIFCLDPCSSHMKII